MAATPTTPPTPAPAPALSGLPAWLSDPAVFGTVGTIWALGLMGAGAAWGYRAQLNSALVADEGLAASSAAHEAKAHPFLQRPPNATPKMKPSDVRVAYKAFVVGTFAAVTGTGVLVLGIAGLMGWRSPRDIEPWARRTRVRLLEFIGAEDYEVRRERALAEADREQERHIKDLLALVGAEEAAFDKRKIETDAKPAR